MSFRRSFILTLAMLLACSAQLWADEATKPAIMGLKFDDHEVETLVALHDMHEIADSGQTLLKWAPLALLLQDLPRDRKPKEILPTQFIAKVAKGKPLQIKEPDWKELYDFKELSAKLKKVELESARRQCLLQDARLAKKPENQRFWRALAAYYAAQSK